MHDAYANAPTPKEENESCSKVHISGLRPEWAASGKWHEEPQRNEENTEDEESGPYHPSDRQR
jgi:hypothetical protein